jgi:signal transduction histidine kinase
VKTVLPARRFRETQWLIIATLLILVAMVVVELEGMVTVAGAAEEEARRGAQAAAAVIGAELSTERGMTFHSQPREGLGVALLAHDRVVSRAGSAGPETPAWWPWASRGEWERAGKPVAGPVRLPVGQVMVAYQPLDDVRVARVVLRVASAPLLGRWRWVGAGLALLVAGAGGLLAIRLLGRVVAPYRDLLAEASRVSEAPANLAEDRFLIETFRDAVRRLEASEAALRRRADELEVLADVLTRESSAGVIIADEGGRVRAANATAEALIGERLPLGEPIPLPIREASGRLRLGARIIGVRRFPLHQPSGAAQGEVLFLADTTHLDALEKALAEREQMALIGELSAGMAHELRNALATISGYLRLLVGAEPHEQARYAAAIGDETGTLATILERFMRFAQPNELAREPVDLRAVAEESVARVRSAFPHASIAVEGPAACVEGDPLALGVVVENLVRNAAEASEQCGAAVTVTVEPDAGSVAVVVEDEGPGVSPEVADRLFSPFVSTKPSGGLGLALARRFARLHGGDVELESRGARGARFVLRVPRGGVS